MSLTALAWIFRPLLGQWITGLTDPGIAIAAAILAFVVPVNLRRGEFLLNCWVQVGLLGLVQKLW